MECGEVSKHLSERGDARGVTPARPLSDYVLSSSTAPTQHDRIKRYAIANRSPSYLPANNEPRYVLFHRTQNSQSMLSRAGPSADQGAARSLFSAFKSAL
ncbi:hypothetical protein EVAR_103895_1 [Eumeta japonica]|uniref:Uncharacterized protein n=1 Tax=Eumeta variegata TaxID=151549 RepID=A0A4C1ZL93_EUMVA|nr:hypothetical protein EVAR_103895_1 [Eumeta japonica]